jgi:hypothetical protein
VKHLPFAFAEHGAIQAANVLNSPRAAMMGIHVVRAFVQLRDLLASNRELAQKFNEQVKRNLARFPADFMFQLSAEEVTGLRSHFATSKPGRGGRRYAPYAFDACF